MNEKYYFAVLCTTILATPAFAEKTLVKPALVCAQNSATTNKQVLYHLSKIETLILEAQKPKKPIKKSL